MAGMDTGGPTYGQVDRDYALRLATTSPEDDGPIWMVNLMHYRAVADYAGVGVGVGAGAGAGVVSGREADDRYAPLEVLADIGADPVFVADVDTQLLGDTPQWDRVGVVKYPTRRSFIEMQSRPDFQAKHVHKQAGMASTIVAGCQPIPDPSASEDPSRFPDWSEVPHPPAADDGPVTLMHLIRFHPGGAASDMAEYQNHAGAVAVPHGVRISGWFGVEGTIVGDGREWHQARFNAFPSKAAFLAVALDPARLQAQQEHRERAIADTYTMILRPTIDRLAESLAP